MASIDVRADGSEKIKYDYDGYYAYIRKSVLSIYPNFAANGHWHDDLEFMYILSGTMEYNVNGEIITIHKGNGIFVNARQMHYGFSSAKQECEYICILLHPMMLCTSGSIDRDFVSPFIADNSIPYILLNRGIDWQKEILDDIEKMYQYKDNKSAQLYIQSLFYHIWILFTENAMKAEQKRKQDRNLSVVKDMLAYIQKHYTEKVTLDNIAKSGNISKSTCLVIFKKYLCDTPTNYLINYRLNNSLNLLKETDLSVSEVALSVGFNGISYFTETFRKVYGCSPSEYRTSKNKL